MKKFFAVLMVILTVFVFSFSGCESNRLKLNYGKKYIKADQLSEKEEEQTYYLFNKDGYGNYRYHNSYYSSYEGAHKVTAYTITFKYEFIESESTVFCFFDSVKSEGNDSVVVNSNWTATLLVTDFVLMGTSNVLYNNEEYAEKELPNFDK